MIMRQRLFAALALLCLLAPPCAAQETKSALTTEVNTNFPDNVIGAITPAVTRSTIIDIINSYYDLNGTTSAACAAHQWIAGLPTLSTINCAQPAFVDISGQVTLVQLPTIGANTALCSIAGGTPIACSKTQLTTLINIATASLSGALPAWPNNTTTYFRGDGTYATLNVAAIGGFGTGIATALGLPVGSAGAPLLFNGAAGTPTSLTLTNATGLPFAGLPAGTSDTALGYWGSTVVSATAIPNCTGAITYSTSTHTFGCNASAGTGTVTSAQLSNGNGINITTTSGANPCVATCNLTINQSLTNATLQASPSNPASTTSTTAVMAGLGTTCHITPVYSGRLRFEFQANAFNSTSGDITFAQARFGTGTAPTNGAAAAGTTVGSEIGFTSSSGSFQGELKVGGIVTGLTVGTAVWIDIGYHANTGTANLTGVSCDAFEF